MSKAELMKFHASTAAEFDDALWSSLVEKNVVKSKDDVTVVFKDGTEIKSRIRCEAGTALRIYVLSVFFYANRL